MPKKLYWHTEVNSYSQVFKQEKIKNFKSAKRTIELERDQAGTSA
ncbi:MAG: hypothetical protein OJF59_001241 [Cytophagales bacterium]|nr:MAG: hypothetical protein OJF59_001241 [Cytophagales bacterium]